MKKIVLALVLSTAFACTKANAQTEKGTLLLGGNVLFQSQDGNNVFTMTPSLGVFIVKNVVVGGQFVVLAGEGYNAWALGPFVRGYFVGSEKGKLFAQGGFNVGGSSGDDTRLGFGLGAGYAIFMNKSIAIEIAALYNKTGEASGIFSLGVGFQIHYYNRKNN